jgi:hypothetical protein
MLARSLARSSGWGPAPLACSGQKTHQAKLASHSAKSCAGQCLLGSTSHGSRWMAAKQLVAIHAFVLHPTAR